MHTEKLPMHQTTITNFDKFAHLLMFLGLSGTLFFDNTRYLRRAISRRRIVFGSFLFPLLAGGIIEILQAHLTTYRTGDWKDFFFDILGAAAGALIALLINRCLKKPQAHE
jgi:VanZ family protein